MSWLHYIVNSRVGRPLLHTYHRLLYNNRSKNNLHTTRGVDVAGAVYSSGLRTRTSQRYIFVLSGRNLRNFRGIDISLGHQFTGLRKVLTLEYIL